MMFPDSLISPRTIALCTFFVSSISVCAQPPEILPETDIPPLTLAHVEKVIGGRTLVSLQVENAEMADVLAAAKRETGVSWRLGPRTAARGPVTLNLKDQPIWALYDALREQIGYNRSGTENALGREDIPLTATTVTGLPLVTHDAGLMQLRVGKPRLTAKHWIAPLTIFVDPKLNIVSNSTRLRVLSATDDKGNDLLGLDRLTSWYRLYPLIWSAQIAQVRPENIGAEIAKLSGVLQFSTVLKRDVWDIPLKTAKFPVVKRFGGDTYTESLSLDAVTANADGTYEVQATRIRQQLINARFMSLMELRRLEAFNTSIFSAIKLLDAQGNELALLKSLPRADTEGGTISRSLTATFGRPPRPAAPKTTTTATPTPATAGVAIAGAAIAPPAPAIPEPVEAPQEAVRLVWNIPLEMRTVEVPFEFNNLPLTPAP